VNRANGTPHVMFIHGLYSSGRGFKGSFLRARYPYLLAPDFRDDLGDRMRALMPLLAPWNDWTLIGSSFGGLMAALYAAQNPKRVRKLILLAPALIWPDFVAQVEHLRIHVPTVVYHGRQDEVIPLVQVEPLIRSVFTDLELHIVDDDHTLHQTVQGMDWDAVLSIQG